MQIKISSVALALALAATNVQAFWRMNCLGRVDLARFDPIVAPGQISGHVHTFQGPNSKLQCIRGVGREIEFVNEFYSPPSRCNLR